MRSRHDRPLERTLGAVEERRVHVEGMDRKGQHAEQVALGLRDGLAGPVPVLVTDLVVLEAAAEAPLTGLEDPASRGAATPRRSRSALHHSCSASASSMMPAGSLWGTLRSQSGLTSRPKPGSSGSGSISPSRTTGWVNESAN